MNQLWDTGPDSIIHQNGWDAIDPGSTLPIRVAVGWVKGSVEARP